MRAATTSWSSGDLMESQRPQCTAKSKQSGQRCRRPPSIGKAVCKIHGGASPGGKVIHGGFVKVAGKYRAALQESLDDKELFNLRQTTAILHTLVKGALERASSGDAPELRRKALALTRDTLDAVRAENSAAVDEKLAALEALLRDGIAEDRNTRVLADRTIKLHKLIQGAKHIDLAKQQVINVRDLTLITAKIMERVRAHVDAPTFTVILKDVDVSVYGGVGRKQLAKGDEAKSETEA